MTDTEWLAARTGELLATAQCYLVPASGRWLAELPGENALLLWALGDSEGEALGELGKVIATWLRGRLPR